MSKPVRLSEIVDAMQEQSDGTEYFFDRQTGLIERVSEYDDLPNDPADAADWQREMIEVRRLIDEDTDDAGRFVRLPDASEINEWSLMERFAREEADERATEALLDAIRGRGAFRRFKDTAHGLGVIDRWYAFRDEAFADIAADWCAGNDITVEAEDAAGGSDTTGA